MAETLITSSYASEVVEGPQDGVAEAVAELAGQEIVAGQARLVIGERVADGFLGAACFTGRLHTGSLLVPSFHVEVCVSPWSQDRTEIGIRPLSRLGSLTSWRTERFVASAYATLDAVAARVSVVEGEMDQPVLRVAA